MSEQEKLNIINTIREELAILKDFLDVKYATKEELTHAKDTRDKMCLLEGDKIDKQFRPMYYMLGVIILFLASTQGNAFLELITKVV